MRRLIIDASSIVKTSLYAGKDSENGRVVQFEGKTVQVNSAWYGYDNVVEYLVTALDALRMVPSQCVFVYEQGNSKIRRRQIYSGYKESREKSAPEVNEETDKCREMVLSAFRNLGAQLVCQPHVEADDVIAYLVEKLDGEKVVMSNDGDMARLISADTTLYKSGQVVTSNPYGPFETRHITLYKSLVGDGDEYKGAVGFGAKAWEALLGQYGTHLDALEGMIKRKTLAELEDDVASFKPFRKVIDGAAHVYQSYACATLYPEWVDGLRTPLQWKAGMVKPAEDYRLKRWGQQIRLVDSTNYEKAVEFLKSKIGTSQVFALDIETATPEESDLWLAGRGKEDKVDVFGSELVSLGLTFGDNGQYTYYFTVDHVDSYNLDSWQVRDAVALIPAHKPIIIQNVAFELPILYACWGEYLKDNGWHGFLPNCLDTAMMSSYVDENLSQGLKQNSKLRLDYDQVSYESVTTLTGEQGSLPTGGKLIHEEDLGEGVYQITRQYKMNELTAEHVLSYGTDDPICTMALYNHYRVIMEIEKTWDVFMAVEQKTAYVKAKAFHDGVPFSLERMLQLEAEDKATFDRGWAVIRDYLIEKGWEGTRCPVLNDLTPADIKTACLIILGLEFKTQTRTPAKLVKLMLDEEKHPELAAHEDAPLLAALIEAGDIAQINDWMMRRFSGEPVFDLNSPKQMTSFLYDVMGLTIRLVNKPTPKEWESKPLQSRLVHNHLQVWANRDPRPVDEALWVAYCRDNSILYPCDKDEIARGLLKNKAKSDEKAVAFALLLDSPDNPVLIAYQEMKKCSTRQTMFYNAYKNLKHWRDNKIHGQSGQCRAVTRRDTPNDPNLGQLPKKGEGVKFRECFIPHKRGAVVVSLDFSGQELRQAAGQSQDENFLACYVGDNLKDVHSLTAAGAMEKKWTKAMIADAMSRFGQEGDDVYDFFVRLRKQKDDPELAKLADDLRKVAKNVNFLAQYDGQAPKLAMTLIITVEDAQTFLDAKYSMFPGYEQWKEDVKSEIKRVGYALTRMGARRHLREALLSSERGVADAAMRQGPNFCIQGSSGEQTKLAQCRIWDSGILFKYDMSFYFTVHDEIVFSVVREHALDVTKVVHDAMVVPYGGLEVPFLSSISLGPNFGRQIECGDWYMPDQIEKALSEVFDKDVATV